jgi:hypothetical protein
MFQNMAVLVATFLRCVSISLCTHFPAEVFSRVCFVLKPTRGNMCFIKLLALLSNACVLPCHLYPQFFCDFVANPELVNADEIVIHTQFFEV